MSPSLSLPGWSSLRALPREARDTLFLLVVIGWTILPHLGHLPVWCGLLAGAVLLWRGRVAWTSSALPGRWTIAAVLALAVALTFWSERTLLGKDAGVTLLVVLMALKTLELRARRDALVVFFLGFFLVLTNFLYSQSLPVALSMLLSVWGMLTALVLAHMPVGRPSLARAAWLAGRTALLGAPVMVMLFLLFPRIGPLWGIPQDAMGRTGLSGSMQLGAVAELAADESIAMRVRFLDAAPSPGEMYFRGPVLSTFNGREWTRLVPTFPAAQRARGELRPGGRAVRYEVALEPSRLPLLPLLEMTPDRPDTAPRIDGVVALLRPDLQWQTDRPIADRLRFEATAYPASSHGPRAPVLGLRDLTDLPAGYNPRTLQWAAELRASPALADADERTLVRAVLDHVRREPFRYTLAPGEYGRDAVDEFWFDRRAGFCEHFASAFVVVMRAMDVPARIVTGYQGADPRPVDGWWIVRQSHAHAWAEVWVRGEGWIRVDPTAAVAPERIERSANLQSPPGLVAGAIGSVNPALAANLRELWETMNNRWNQWVLNYSRGQQFELLRGLGFEAPSWQDLAYVLGLLAIAGALAGAGWAWWDRQRQDPWQRLQGRVAQRLARLGVVVQAHEGPRRRAAAVREALGAAGEDLAQRLDALDRQRYGATGSTSRHRTWWTDFRRAADEAARRSGHAHKPAARAS